MNKNVTSWSWSLLTLLILFALGTGLWIATKKIDYTWRWNRVPQYFVYLNEDAIVVPADARVEKVDVVGESANVTVLTEYDETLTYKVDADNVSVYQDETLFEGDTIGYIAEWRAGPLLVGLWTTLWLSAAASVFGLIIGLVTGLCRVSSNTTLRQLSVIYVELIRGTPLLVQIFIFYFFLGTVLDISRIVAGISALAIFAGAYVAEIIRAGIQSIPKGQMEAARSLGMNVPQAMIHIILPQAFKRTLPPLAGQFISLIKDSSLVSVIAITDLTKSGREVITSTFATFEIWFIVALLYLLLTLSLSQVIAWVERRLAVSD
ncbi:polar amino acid transport system permease protein [Malonomonas rubra DSM 5091]|uniref:Putative glutamine transport system permease protein GlnP n=1 Tax=Malonomonas rubra DSM 5091 TaxID=1122189 RepID=A0A1M6NBN4_MALRU|nr:amino acid ABC transporter permease [Malonomonas rubra]SHJ92956.1 polar amino acid transport system permease protein [Malonomonas rubra DSM 5091]